MSEHLNNSAVRQEILKRLIRELHEGKSVDEVKGEFARLLNQVGASEIAEIEQALIAEGLPEMEVKRLCDVHVAVFRDALDRQAPPESVPGHPVHTFRVENVAAGAVLDGLEKALEAVKERPDPARLEGARTQLGRLREYEKHYLRKENILFPYLEKHKFTGPSSVMWAIHDDIRAGWKALAELLEAGPADDPAGFAARIDAVFGPLSTAMREMFFKEENILFPTALDKLSEEEWRAARAQEGEIWYAFVEPGDQWPPQAGEGPAGAVSPPVEVQAEPAGDLLQLETGALSVKEVNLLLKHLPVEVSFVDDTDTVRFFSGAEERIFSRTPAIVGRRVQKCHPPASVHRVQRILDDFRTGRRDQAEFWIQTQGRFIHIRYFAVRDEDGRYRGTLEVVQDVTRIRELQGERRLLDD